MMSASGPTYLIFLQDNNITIKINILLHLLSVQILKDVLGLLKYRNAIWCFDHLGGAINIWAVLLL